jgi:16S rRNA (guanine(966)-N(2))-methyltransferase RsmD
MRTQLRIVAGTLRGRKITCTVNPRLRPAPQMVREALFSILAQTVPGRPFYDLFAGTGAVGLEALSRGADPVAFVERDFRVAGEIERHLQLFAISGNVSVRRADVYRWAETWEAPDTAVNVFLGPPYPDFQKRAGDLVGLIATCQRKVRDDSVIVLQAEVGIAVADLPEGSNWKTRRYGRNLLLIWVKQA